MNEISDLRKKLETANLDRAELVGKLIDAYYDRFGEEAIQIARRVLRQRGISMGEKIRLLMGGRVSDLRTFRENLTNVLGTTSKGEKVINEQTHLEVKVTYCPWVDAWKRAGLNSELLCDIISESDIGVAEGASKNMICTSDHGLARGRNSCKIEWKLG